VAEFEEKNMDCAQRARRRLPWVQFNVGTNLVLLISSLAAYPIAAHHSEAAFDIESVVVFTGVVTRYAWRNPHVYIDVEARDTTGAPVQWVVETGATPILTRSGWTPESLTVGEEITVRAHPERGERTYALLLTLEKSDGTILEQNPRESESAARATSLQGLWRGYQPTIGPFFSSLNSIPLTQKGATAKGAYSVLRDSPAADCIPQPPPSSLIAASLYYIDIALGPDIVTMRSELLDAQRTIHLDGRQHPSDGELTNQGHSVGHWEGATLVVDTRLLAEHRSANGEGVPSSPAKHVIERYTLIEDGARMRVEVFLEDPEYLAEPFEGSLELRYTPDGEFLRYNCEIEVSRRFTLGP
jgi:hypothetical protein